MKIDSGIAGLLGALIGAGTSIWMSYINNNKAYKLQIDLENLKRKNEAKDLQRETLLKIQEELQLIISQYFEIYFKNLDVYKINGEWKSLDNNNSEEVKLTNNIKELTLYVERIENKALREGTRIISNKITELRYLKSYFEVEKLLPKTLLEFNEHAFKVGEEIRKTY